MPFCRGGAFSLPERKEYALPETGSQPKRSGGFSGGATACGIRVSVEKRIFAVRPLTCGARRTMKESWKPGTMIYPLPAVLVGCGDAPDNWNLLTVAWTGTVCTAPPMCYVSVRPERHSHALIARTGEFTINLTTAAMARAVDWCGVRSGRDYDKFRETGLTPLRGAVVAAPALEESPVVVECRVRQILPLGSHDMFLAEVVNVLVDDRYIDSATGRFDLERAGLVAYSHGEYFRLGELIGHFGWSVRRRKIIVRERKGRR